jgi:ABC-type uncharacterized transport system involved in gliding motility auxiliary subunit
MAVIMKPDMKRFAPIGLYISLLAALVSGALYIVFHVFTLPLQISLGFILLGAAGYIIMDPERARQALTGRQARYGSNAFILSLAVFGILIVVNYLGYKNSFRWDLTENKGNTLAPETINTLSSLTQPIKALAFYTPRTPADDAKKLLESYKRNSKGKFDFTFVDPEIDIAAATSANVTRDATIVFSLGDRKEQVTFASEQDFTSAIIRLVNPGERDLYFLSGHGEFDPNGSGDTSYNQLQLTLQNKNYKISTLNLISEPNIPSNALAIIIAGYKKSLSDNEINIIKTYLDKGGSLVVFSDSPFAVNLTSNPIDPDDPLIKYLRDSWGVQLGNDLVIDPNVSPAIVAVANSYGDHAITQKLNNVTTIFPTARSVTSASSPPAITQTILASTSSNAWGETNWESIQKNQVTVDKGLDVTGPVPLGIAATNSDTKGRIVVIGDASFASNRYFDQYANSDLAVNSLDWAAEQENLISLTPKQVTTRFMPPPQIYVMGLILFGSVFLLPGAVIAAGVFAFISRRRRG